MVLKHSNRRKKEWEPYGVEGVDWYRKPVLMRGDTVISEGFFYKDSEGREFRYCPQGWSSRREWKRNFDKHNWKYTNGRKELNVLSSGKVVRYGYHEGDNIYRFSGSSEIRRLNDKRKKERIERAKVDADNAVDGNAADRVLPAKQISLFQDDPGKPAGSDAPGSDKRGALYVYTRKSKARLTEYAQTFVRTGKVKFMTLTFVNKVTDREAMDCFSAFMQNWRVCGRMSDYISVMERQGADAEFPGNPHFHVLVRSFIDIKEERERWLRIMDNNGIRLRKPNGEEFTRSELEESFIDGPLPIGLCERWGLDPFPKGPDGKRKRRMALASPVDIRKVQTARGAVNYITKYITKSIIEGTEYGVRPWTCSNRVSRLYKRAMVIPELFDAADHKVNTYVRKRDVKDMKGNIRFPAGSVKKPFRGVNPYATSIEILNKEFFHPHLSELDNINRRYLDSREKRPPPPVRLEWIEYYCEFCREYNVDEVAMSKEEYYNGYNNVGKLLGIPKDSRYSYI